MSFIFSKKKKEKLFFVLKSKVLNRSWVFFWFYGLFINSGLWNISVLIFFNFLDSFLSITHIMIRLLIFLILLIFLMFPILYNPCIPCCWASTKHKRIYRPESRLWRLINTFGFRKKKDINQYFRFQNRLVLF